MNTIFSKIITGEIPSFKIKEDENFYAFLDIRPIEKGHTLVIPKYEVDRFFDMEDKYLSQILLFAKPIVRAIETVISCQRVGSLIAGTEVPHAHLHLVPLIDMSRFSFAYAKPAEQLELKHISEKIVSALR